VQDPSSFTIFNIAPTSFSLTSPSSGSATTNDEPVFTWTLSDGTNVAYNFTIDDNNDFSSPLFEMPGIEFTDGETNGAFAMPAGILANNTVYFWRVTASNSAGSVLPSNGLFVLVTDFPATCLGDCDGSGVVDFNDLVEILFEFGSTEGGVCDADESGEVDFNDLVAALFIFGDCP